MRGTIYVNDHQFWGIFWNLCIFFFQICPNFSWKFVPNFFEHFSQIICIIIKNEICTFSIHQFYSWWQFFFLLRHSSTSWHLTHNHHLEWRRDTKYIYKKNIFRGNTFCDKNRVSLNFCTLNDIFSFSSNSFFFHEKVLEIKEQISRLWYVFSRATVRVKKKLCR